MKLPSPSSCRPKPNLQIADVADDPSFVPSLSSLSLVRAVSDGMGACPTPAEVVPIDDDLTNTYATMNVFLVWVVWLSVSGMV